MNKILTVIGMVIVVMLCIAGTIGTVANLSHDDIKAAIDFVTDNNENAMQDRLLQMQLRTAIMQSISEDYEVDYYYWIGQSFDELTEGNGVVITTGYYQTGNGQENDIIKSVKLIMPLDERITEEKYPNALSELQTAQYWLQHNGGYRYLNTSELNVLQNLFVSIEGYFRLTMYYLTLIGEMVWDTVELAVKYIQAAFYLMGLTNTL